jgi:hypothetical protein
MIPGSFVSIFSVQTLVLRAWSAELVATVGGRVRVRGVCLRVQTKSKAKSRGLVPKLKIRASLFTLRPRRDWE